MKFQLQSYFYFIHAEQISVVGGEDDAGISGGNDGDIAGMDSDNPADYGDDGDDEDDAAAMIDDIISPAGLKFKHHLS